MSRARRAAAVVLTASLVAASALLAGSPANAGTSGRATTLKPKVLPLTMLKTARTVIAGDHVTIRATMRMSKMGTVTIQRRVDGSWVDQTTVVSALT